jgi:catechol 2,3-dioxygenase-like lactoylglutathione lyase family enzyme
MLLNLSHIGQIALPVTDVDRSEAFYKDVLGLPKLYRFGDLTFSIVPESGCSSKNRRKASGRKVASTFAARTSRSPSMS